MVAFFLCCGCGAPALADEGSSLPVLHTNEEFVEDVTRRSSLDVTDLKAVLSFVLSQLPAEVHVFPTENYYYFYFYQNGVRYAGNFRFDVEERDKGNVEFIYFKASTGWIEDPVDYHATLGPDDGVTVEKVGTLAYKLTFAGKSVTFLLNDLSDVRPPDGTLGPEEEYLGPVADESGIRFFLIFDRNLKLFHYVLDETVPVADELVPVKGARHVLIGRRTGFGFFKDDARSRKLLIGVYTRNVDVNNYLDGPFDQLPDNFLKGDALRRALLAARPEIDQPLDRLGIGPDKDYRELIAPYMEYESVDELLRAETCAEEKDEPAIFLCLSALNPPQ